MQTERDHPREGKGSTITLTAVALVSVIASCGPRDVVRGQRDGQAIISITDRTGKSWDISHGVNELDLDPERFQFGLGPHAIEPINDPSMLSPGDPGYPRRSSSQRVVGVVRGGEARAYPISVLRRREIANDSIAGEALAVGY